MLQKKKKKRFANSGQNFQSFLEVGLEVDFVRF